MISQSFVPLISLISPEIPYDQKIPAERMKTHF